MKIQFFKNKDVNLKKISISEKLQKEINVEPTTLKYINDLISSFFILEKDINHNQLKKVFVVGIDKSLVILFIDSKNKVSKSKNKILNKDLITEEEILDVYIKDSIELSPYELNKIISKLFSTIIKNLKNNIFYRVKSKNLRSTNLIEALYKSDERNVVNYIQNICFKNIDKDLFKECYPYYLHSKKVKKYCLYNILSENLLIRNNFLEFKKKNSFLSMIFINKTLTILKLNFLNYSEDKVLNNLKLLLKKEFKFIKDEQFEYLIGKSYNHFLYIKTPEKYFNYIQKSHLTDFKFLTLSQLNFLSKVYYKNKTYIDPQEIRKIISNDYLINKFIKILKYREYLGGEIDCKIDNIENFIIKNETSFNEHSEILIEKIEKIHQKLKFIEPLKLDNFFGKKIKINLIDTEILKSDFRLLNENNKPYYNNTKDIYKYFNKYYAINDYFAFLILNEGRQRNILIVKFNFSNGSFESIINYTPRLKEITNNILKSNEFKEYFFNNFIF